MARKRLPSKLHLLTARQVQTAGEGDHSDGGGLVLRVSGNSAAWVFRYTAATGKRREMGLGSAHRGNPSQAGQSLTGARELAARARQSLQEGCDPIDDRDRVREQLRAAATDAAANAKRQTVTLARAARDYHERVIEPSRTTKHAAQWISSLENHVPTRLWSAPIHEVTPPVLLAALAEIKPHERARNLPNGHRLIETVQRIRQRLDAVFEDAIFHGGCSTNPAAAIKRKLREGMPRREARQFAALPYAEMRAFMRQLRGVEGTSARCLEFAVLTAARTGEVISAEWDEVDLKAAVRVVPAHKMKAREPHTVYLSDRAVEVLRSVQGLSWTYVFPSPMREGKPLSNAALLSVLDRMKVRGRSTVHGLCRATFSTWANETGAARSDVIEACLAHEETNRVRASYNRAEFAGERRALLRVWGQYLSQEAATVTPIHSRRHG